MYTVNISGLTFEWDDEKNADNIRKHGVSFGAAMAAFEDESAPCYFDADHSQEEERYLLLGMCPSHGILVVSHCYREEELTIRIISARKANEKEKNEYRRYYA